MIRVKHGDLDKLAVLYERYNRALFGFFFKVTLNSQASEDLVQTVFFKIIKYREQYRVEEGSFVTWMFRIAHNANIDHYHSLERRRNEVRIDEADVRGDGDPDDDFLKKERSRRIKEALGLLTAEQREVLILSRYQGLKYEERAGPSAEPVLRTPPRTRPEIGCSPEPDHSGLVPRISGNPAA